MTPSQIPSEFTVICPYMNTPIRTHEGETFIASASSFYDINDESPYKAFSSQETTDAPGSDTNQWTTGSPSYRSSFFTGTYICCTTTVDQIEFKGEWLQLQCTNSHVVQSFSIMANFGNPVRAPESFILVGSDDGIAWTLLHSEHNAGKWDSKQEKGFIPTIKKEAKFFRLIITGINGPNEWLTIDKFRLFENTIKSPEVVTTHPLSGDGASMCE
jgi:hypothetical protein